MAEHPEQLAVCMEKWNQVDNHFKESVPIRDKVAIMWNAYLHFWTLIVVIVAQIGAFIYIWGGQKEIINNINSRLIYLEEVIRAK